MAPGERAMTEKEFMNKIANGRIDILEALLSILNEIGASYCVIGGLAVNAYAEPVVSLDLDVVITSKDLAKFKKKSLAKGFKIQDFEHSVNLSSAGSDLRIQIQTDTRYQDFVARSVKKKVLGYMMRVASLEDVLQGKTWAFSDETRRKSKRQKDLADIFRLVETHPRLRAKLPPNVLVEWD
jgi:hypothetical protein